MPVRHAFTVDEWHRMGEIGLFDEDARVELLDGEVIEMSPIGSRHAGVVNRINRLLITSVGEAAVVSPQNPVRLDERSEPQPDMVLLAPRADDYTSRHPTPEEILLLIEVADSSLAYDRDRKAEVYARTGVSEYWIVDLSSNTVLVMRGPGPGGYTDLATLGEAGVITVVALPGVSLSVREILR